MKSVPKQLIIDKDIFQGTNQAALCRFTKNHFLIRPDVLLYECLTNPEEKDILQQRFEQVMLAGAYVCPRVNAIVFKEAQRLSPYAFLPDLKMTTDIRASIRKKNVSFDSHYIREIYEKHCQGAQTLLDAAPKTVEKIASQEPELLEKAKKYQGNRAERFRLWVETVTSRDIHELAIEKLDHLTDSPERFCLSNEWITWNYFCFICVIYLEYTFLRTVGNENLKLLKAEHDCQDIEYVTYLSRVDGLLTKDKKLAIPIANVAFPDKDVFSSLDEVPENYICNWT